MNAVLHSFAYCLEFLREQVADVSAADMVGQPNGVPNHPAWVIGHLTYSCELVGGVIGLAPWLPEGWGKRFGPGSVPVSDVRVYETKEGLLRILGDAEARIADGVGRLDETSLDAAFPDAALRALFPTVRHALTQVLVGHTANHVGQVTVWRKLMGLPAMSRGFQ